MNLPQLCILCSKENLEVARAVQANFTDRVEATIWDQGIFAASVAGVVATPDPDLVETHGLVEAQGRTVGRAHLQERRVGTMLPRNVQ